MEYEIDDDPQGLPDPRDGARDGGIRPDRSLFTWARPVPLENLPGDQDIHEPETERAA